MRRSILYFIILIVCSLVFFAGCGKNANAKNEEDKEQETVIPVEVAIAESGNITAFITGTTTLESEEETEVVAKVSGVVEHLYTEEGRIVQAGDILAKLDDEKLTAQVEQAKAALLKLENEKIRNEELYEKNLISAQDFQASKYDYEYQKAAYEMARLDLDYTEIKAPISGIVAERMIKVGNMVLANQPVFQITEVDPLLAVLYIPERHIQKLKVDQKALLRIDALGNTVHHGYVKRISPVVDPATGTVKVTVEVHDPSFKIKPGMFARIQITHDVHQNTVLIPKDALIIEDQETSIYVMTDSIAIRRDIQTGYVNTSHIEVLSGVSVSDTVITTGKGSLKDSSKVEIVGISTKRHVE